MNIGDLAADTDWYAALMGASTAVHAVDHVDIMRDTAANLLTEFRRVNVNGTLALARQIASAGARRFDFISPTFYRGKCAGTTTCL